MNETIEKWLDDELSDYEQVFKEFRSKQQRMYYIWMAAAIAGMVALGFAVGYDWKYVAKVHLVIGLVIALIIWLCVLITNRAVTMKTVRKKFVKALEELSPDDREAFISQKFGKIDFMNTSDDSFPARLMVSEDYWLYFRGACSIFKVGDIEKLGTRRETTRVNYSVGGAKVRQRIGIGVSITVGYNQNTCSRDTRPDQIYLAKMEQLSAAQTLIQDNCKKAENLWTEN